MITPQRFTEIVAQIRAGTPADAPPDQFEVEWMNGDFQVEESRGCQIYTSTRAPDEVAAIEFIADPQLIRRWIDFEAAGRTPSALARTHQEQADALLALVSPNMKIGISRADARALVQSATPLCYETPDDSIQRLFSGVDGIVCLFRFHRERLASLLVANMPLVPGFKHKATDTDWFMKAVDLLWEGPGTGR